MYNNIIIVLLLINIYIRIVLSIVDTMPKLYFRHGAVSSAKTLNLLCVAHTYKQQGKQGISYYYNLIIILIIIINVYSNVIETIN